MKRYKINAVGDGYWSATVIADDVMATIQEYLKTRPGTIFTVREL